MRLQPAATAASVVRTVPAISILARAGPGAQRPVGSVPRQYGLFGSARRGLNESKVIMTHNARLDSWQKWFRRAKIRVGNWSVGKKVIAIISAPLFVGLAAVIATRALNTPSSPPCAPNSVFIGEDKITDRTHMAPNERFIKSWTLRNPDVQGLCTWTTEYNAVWIGGPLLANMPSYFLMQEVDPGQEAIIRIAMETPAKPGEYKSIWILRTPTGIRFGDPFWVDIIVSRSQR